MVFGAGVAPTIRAVEEPSLERLLELNAAELFGGSLKVKDGRMTLTFEKDQFAHGFATTSRRGRFIFDPGQILSQRHKKWSEGADKQLAMVGINDGRADSRFELEGDFEIRFSLKIPDLSARSSFAVRLNQRGKEYIQTNFLTDIRVTGKGRKRSEKATDRRYWVPGAWFDTKAKEGVPFTVTFKDGKLTILTGKETKKKDDKKGQAEIVSMADIETPASGKLSFLFANMEFVLVRNLRIEGDLPRSWAKKEIDRLRRTGTLRTKENAAREEKEPAGGELAKVPGKDGKAGAADKKSRDRDVEVDIDKDDPEIGEDL